MTTHDKTAAELGEDLLAEVEIIEFHAIKARERGDHHYSVKFQSIARRLRRIASEGSVSTHDKSTSTNGN